MQRAYELLALLAPLNLNDSTANQSLKVLRVSLPTANTIWFLPYFMVLVSGVLWGLTFSLARIATEEQAHPLGLAFWQALGGGLILLLVCLIRRSWPALTLDILKRSCVIALLGTAVPGTMYFYAASRVPVGVLAITVALVPILTYALALALRVDQFSHKRFLGIIAGFAAIVFLIAPGTSLPNPAMAQWVFLALGAAVFYTLENVYVDVYIPKSTDMVVLLMGGLIIAGVILLPLVATLDAFVPINYPLGNPEWAILGMIVVSSVAYLIFLYLIKYSGAVFASVTAYIITVFGVFWGILLFNEQHSLWVWGALLLMLLGMSLVKPRRRN